MTPTTNTRQPTPGPILTWAHPTLASALAHQAHLADSGQGVRPGPPVATRDGFVVACATPEPVANLNETVALCDEAERQGFPGADRRTVAAVRRQALRSLRSLMAVLDPQGA